MNQEFLRRHWYAAIYEQHENNIEDINLIIELAGKKPLNILEAACGGGRISVPLAKVGHKVTGFDFDEFMLAKALKKGSGLNNVSFFKADALIDDWGKNYDIVVLAGNFLLNIESNIDYKQSQQILIQKAADSVKQGGHMYLDFDCFIRPNKVTQGKRKEWVCFEGNDDLETFGQYIIISGEFNNETCINKDFRRYEITPKAKEKFISECTIIKHFPNLYLVREWLKNAGWIIEYLYGGYDKRSSDENIIGNRAIIWAKKI